MYQNYLENLDYQLEEYIIYDDYSTVYSFEDWTDERGWFIEEMEIED